ncbi:MAG: hypothetical protein GX654_13265 [Desulfatiglans sp.]|jgi:anionic cell wall polymer biosynthesis LytR-Cps2A-Psr (LCP) family protein|nr:hypothetical protein [Desulfatiglans sp.]
MLSKSIKSILLVTLLVIAIFTVTTFAAGNPDINDTVELKNGDKISGHVLTDSFTVTSPYSIVTLERDKISEIAIMPEGYNHDIVTLNEAGILEGTIDEASITIKNEKGEKITLKKEECKKIVFKPIK